MSATDAGPRRPAALPVASASSRLSSAQRRASAYSPRRRWTAASVAATPQRTVRFPASTHTAYVDAAAARAASRSSWK